MKFHVVSGDRSGDLRIVGPVPREFQAGFQNRAPLNVTIFLEKMTYSGKIQYI